MGRVFHVRLDPVTEKQLKRQAAAEDRKETAMIARFVKLALGKPVRKSYAR